MANTALQISEGWFHAINRLKYRQAAINQVQASVVNWAMTKGVQEAHRQLDYAVYNTPEPPGSHRTGATRRAVKKSGVASDMATHGMVGEIRVDRAVANRDGFYYPRVLEEGMKKYPAYGPRYFWHATRVLMGHLFRMQGQKGLGEIKRLMTVE